MKKAAQTLINLVKEGNKQFVDENPVLDAIQSGQASVDFWKTFAIQRSIAARLFEDLLKAAIQAGQRVEDKPLVQALQANLNDELGIDEQGAQHIEKAHHTWRKDFYRALGISELELETTEPSRGTKAYHRILQMLIASGDAYKMAGALLVWEGTIPHEFNKIKIGRDLTFKQIFVDAPGDTGALRDQKAKARLYIDDHITHDASSHFPMLFKALEPHTSSWGEMRRIKQGAKLIIKAKKAFYQSIK